MAQMLELSDKDFKAGTIKKKNSNKQSRAFLKQKLN